MRSVPARSRLAGRLSRSRTGFGKTWWGRAWVEALESTARLDPNRLPRGRTYARNGAVSALEVVHGEVRARVQGSHFEPYHVRLRVRPFSSEEWERATRTLATTASHVAALVDGVIPGGVEAELRKQSLSLLPGPGELSPQCSCPDWAVPCKHAAAVCYLVADLLDADPFVVFALRGRGRDHVLASLRSLRAETGSAGSLPPEDFNVAAVDRLASGVPLDSVARYPGESHLPEPLPLPASPGGPSPLIDQLGDDGPIDVEALRWLASDAAARALELATAAGDGALLLTEEEDLARIAASRIGDPMFDTWAQSLGVHARVLMRLALAWRAGGKRGLVVLDAEPGRAPEMELKRARAAMARLGPGTIARGDRVTHGRVGLQLRWGGDGLWYLLRRRGTQWELQDPPSADPTALVGPNVGPRSEPVPSPRRGGIAPRWLDEWDSGELGDDDDEEFDEDGLDVDR